MVVGWRACARHMRVGHRQRGVRRQVPVGGRPGSGRPSPRRAPRPSRRCPCTAGPGYPQPDAGRSQRSWARARSRELAATPPPIIRWSTPSSRQARTALRVSTSTTASWKEAATSRTGTPRRPPAWPRSSGRRRSSDRRRRSRTRRRAGRSDRAGRRSPPGRPRGRSRSMTGPPGKPGSAPGRSCRRPRRPRRRWSRPAGATSEVMSGTAAARSGRRDTSRAIVGSGSGPCSSWSTQMCEARWFTPYSGLPSA